MIDWLLHLIDVTTGPFYMDVTAIVAGFVGTFWLYQHIAAPIIRALWAAVVAAPKIAIYTGRLVELLEDDVIGRLDNGQERFAMIDAHLALIDTEIAALRAALNITTTTVTTVSAPTT